MIRGRPPFNWYGMEGRFESVYASINPWFNTLTYKLKSLAVYYEDLKMIIYGVALLSFCLLTGIFLGEIIGLAIGVNANVGGVGIAMLLLIVLSNYSDKILRIDLVSSNGIQFWSSMYIPIVVAMAAKQNVAAAMTSGPIAILAGILAVIISFALIPVISRMGPSTTDISTYDKSPEQVQ